MNARPVFTTLITQNINRLTHATPDNSLKNLGLPQEQYGYDPVGNRTSSGHQPGAWSYNADNQLIQYPRTTPFSGAAPADTSVSFTAQGHTQEEKSGAWQRNYRYNAAERLIETRQNGQTTSYRYDPFGRRLGKTTGNSTTYYLYSDTGLLAEVDSQGQLSKAYGFNPKAAQQGLWSTDAIWQANVSGNSLTSSTTSYHYLHTDHLATPILATDMAGNATWKGASEAFGATMPTIEATEMNLRFPGQYWDGETNSHYNLHRDYIPAYGRYTQADPMGVAGGLEVYGYSNQNPIIFGDHSGKTGVIICVYPVPGCTQGGRPVPPPAIPVPTFPDITFPEKKCYRYEYRDCNGDLVYIGIINDLDRRAREHEYDGVVAKYACKQCRITKTYWDEAPNRATCKFREKLSIAWNRPIFNSQYNPEHPVLTLPNKYLWKIKNCPCEE